jgi:hypothetical protein
LYKYAYVWFSLAFAVTLLGFWPSFFSGPLQNDPVRTIHGLLATAWMLMLIAQSWLIAHRHVLWHRRVGKLSYVLAPALVISAALVIPSMLGSHHFPPRLVLSLIFSDVCSLAAFTLLYGLAIWHRRSVVLHARYMSATVLVILVPALGRVFGIYVPGVHGLEGALNPSYWVVEAACVALMFADWRKGRSLTPYALTLVFLVAVNWGLWQAPDMPAFAAWAKASA